TTNAGYTWDLQATGINGNYDNLNDIFFVDANTGFTVGNNGRTLKTTNGGVGITENTVENQINVFPNPASDLLTLNIDNKNNGDLTINIYNLIGMLVKTEVLNQNQNQISLESLNNGVYMLEVKSKEWTKKQKLIIKK
ncbi:MAG: T9SS type A sorting domain-containing protein, partial [Bacteroidales bacterium]|nr:T9SS type A sorting domain-containing protein [Bacteroidales bacterium]